jgi:hypothetical protein
MIAEEGVSSGGGVGVGGAGFSLIDAIMHQWFKLPVLVADRSDTFSLQCPDIESPSNQLKGWLGMYIPDMAAGLLAHLFSAGDEISSSRIARILSLPHPSPDPDFPGRLMSFTAWPVSS